MWRIMPPFSKLKRLFDPRAEPLSALQRAPKFKTLLVKGGLTCADELRFGALTVQAKYENCRK